MQQEELVSRLGSVTEAHHLFQAAINSLCVVDKRLNDEEHAEKVREFADTLINNYLMNAVLDPERVNIDDLIKVVLLSDS
jgi:hypothetical protein